MKEINRHRRNGLPEGWEWVRIADTVKVNPKLPFEIIDEAMEVSFLPMKLVEQKES